MPGDDKKSSIPHITLGTPKAQPAGVRVVGDTDNPIGEIGNPRDVVPEEAPPASDTQVDSSSEELPDEEDAEELDEDDFEIDDDSDGEKWEDENSDAAVIEPAGIPIPGIKRSEPTAVVKEDENPPVLDMNELDGSETDEPDPADDLPPNLSESMRAAVLKDRERQKAKEAKRPFILDAARSKGRPPVVPEPREEPEVPEPPPEPESERLTSEDTCFPDDIPPNAKTPPSLVRARTDRDHLVVLMEAIDEGATDDALRDQGYTQAEINQQRQLVAAFSERDKTIREEEEALTRQKDVPPPDRTFAFERPVKKKPPKADEPPPLPPDEPPSPIEGGEMPKPAHPLFGDFPTRMRLNEAQKQAVNGEMRPPGSDIYEADTIPPATPRTEGPGNVPIPGEDDATELVEEETPIDTNHNGSEETPTGANMSWRNAGLALLAIIVLAVLASYMSSNLEGPGIQGIDDAPAQMQVNKVMWDKTLDLGNGDTAHVKYAIITWSIWGSGPKGKLIEVDGDVMIDADGNDVIDYFQPADSGGDALEWGSSDPVESAIMEGKQSRMVEIISAIIRAQGGDPAKHFSPARLSVESEFDGT